MDAALNARIFRAVDFLASHPLADQVLRLIASQIGVTGWEIARELQSPLSEVEQALSELAKFEMVKADGQGLDAYYAPSGQAYTLRLRMAS